MRARTIVLALCVAGLGGCVLGNHRLDFTLFIGLRGIESRLHCPWDLNGRVS